MRVRVQAAGSRQFKPIVRESKFRYITGKVLSVTQSYTHLTDVATKMGSETNVLQVPTQTLS
jgi:hypothetical protein